MERRLPRQLLISSERTANFVGESIRTFCRGWDASKDGFVKAQEWDGNPNGFDLDVFATRDIAEGEELYSDEPSVRGHLDRTARPCNFDDDYKGDDVQNFTCEPRCENCRRKINMDELRKRKDKEQQDEMKGIRNAKRGVKFTCACSNVGIEAKKYFCHCN